MKFEKIMAIIVCTLCTGLLMTVAHFGFLFFAWVNLKIGEPVIYGVPILPFSVLFICIFIWLMKTDSHLRNWMKSLAVLTLLSSCSGRIHKQLDESKNRIQYKTEDIVIEEIKNAEDEISECVDHLDDCIK